MERRIGFEAEAAQRWAEYRRTGEYYAMEDVRSYVLARARGEDPSAYDRCYCERDALDPSVVNCESQRFILRDQSRKIGNFSGEIAMLAEDPEDYTDAKNLNKDLKRTLYLPVRGDPSLTVIDVTRRLVTDASRRLVDANAVPPALLRLK